MISIDDAQEQAEKYGLRQVIIFGWDGVRTHVATFGKTVLDSAQAAAGANSIKRGWDWPSDTIAESGKVQKLIDENAALKERVSDLKYLLNKLDIEE